mmetsp:Transcript_29686/g.60631  ORF Transcript_29686/g.60631 Transcript_29686/m.60631 type:complete len:227 (-) Transcript_29686:1958-2638(-)
MTTALSSSSEELVMYPCGSFPSLISSSASALVLTLTTSPSSTHPSRTRRLRGLSTSLASVRFRGRAPYLISYPRLARQSTAALLTSKVIFCPDSSRLAMSDRPISAIRSMCCLWRRLNMTVSSMRLRSSGLSVCLTTSMIEFRTCGSFPTNSSGSWDMTSAPILDVMTTMTLRKSTFLPWESVRCPSSKSWSRRFQTSRCPFSNSSRRSTWYGLRRTLSVRTPPSS